MYTNFPNILTLSRVLATPVVCLFLALQAPFGNWSALAVFLYACVTDFLDGYLARSWQQQSNFGRMLDPIADKLLVASVLLMLVSVERLAGLAIVPAAIILWREILVSGLREHLAEFRVSVPVTRLAKWKTGLQMTALGFLVAGDAGPVVAGWSATSIGIAGLWAAAALTVFTGYDYLRAGLASMRPERSGAAMPALDPVTGRPGEGTRVDG